MSTALAHVANIEQLYQPSIRYHDFIQHLASPVQKHFSVKQLTYTYLATSGLSYMLSSNVEPFKEYLGRGLLTIDPIVTKRDIPEVTLWSEIQSLTSDEYKRNIAEILQKYNLENGFSLRLRAAHGYHVFAFAGGPEQPNFLNLCFSKMNYIRRYTEFFLQEAASLHSEIVTRGIDLSAYINKDCGKINSFGINDAQFLTDISAHDIAKIFNKLSKREHQCLKFYASGLTAREIAVELGLSPRTVEFHVNNIKYKLDCRNKADIINKFAVVREYM